MSEADGNIMEDKQVSPPAPVEQAETKERVTYETGGHQKRSLKKQRFSSCQGDTFIWMNDPSVELGKRQEMEHVV